MDAVDSTVTDCPICFLAYNEERPPLSTLCGHSFCNDCGEKLAGPPADRRAFVCPLCRERWEPSEHCLRVNTALRDLIEQIAAARRRSLTGRQLSNESVGTPEWRYLRIDFSELEPEALIDTGAFGEVHRCRWRGELVAAKLIRSGEIAPSLLGSFRREVEVMSVLHHPNVVLMLGACAEPPRLCLVMELMSGGSLYGLLHVNSVKLEPVETRSLSLDIAHGLQYLHSLNILHRDLKSKNVLLTRSLPRVAKLCDFGLSRVRLESATMTGNIGTPQWTAPEVLNGSKYTFSADIYSFGMVLLEIVSYRLPFAGMHPLAVIMAVAVKKELPDIPKDTPPQLKEAIIQCTIWSAVERVCMRQLLALLEAYQPPAPRKDSLLYKTLESFERQDKSPELEHSFQSLLRTKNIATHSGRANVEDGASEGNVIASKQATSLPFCPRTEPSLSPLIDRKGVVTTSSTDSTPSSTVSSQGHVSSTGKAAHSGVGEATDPSSHWQAQQLPNSWTQSYWLQVQRQQQEDADMAFALQLQQEEERAAQSKGQAKLDSIIAHELQAQEEQKQPPRWAMYSEPQQGISAAARAANQTEAIQMAKDYVLEDIKVYPAGRLHPTRTAERTWHPTAADVHVQRPLPPSVNSVAVKGGTSRIPRHQPAHAESSSRSKASKTHPTSPPGHQREQTVSPPLKGKKMAKVRRRRSTPVNHNLLQEIRQFNLYDLHPTRTIQYCSLPTRTEYLQEKKEAAAEAAAEKALWYSTSSDDCGDSTSYRDVVTGYRDVVAVKAAHHKAESLKEVSVFSRDRLRHIAFGDLGTFGRSYVNLSDAWDKYSSNTDSTGQIKMFLSKQRVARDIRDFDSRQLRHVSRPRETRGSGLSRRQLLSNIRQFNPGQLQHVRTVVRNRFPLQEGYEGDDESNEKTTTN